MKAQDVMTRNVATVKADAAVREIAALMVEKHISGLPVVDESGRIVGIISESDLMHRAEVGTEAKRKWWFRIFADADSAAREYAKSHGLRARDVMSSKVVTVRHDADLADVADILDRHHIKRVPVLEDGRLAGIVSRGDLVRALSSAKVTRAERKIDNASLLKVLRERMHDQPWLNDSYLNLSVNDGVVELWGLVSSNDQHRALLTLVEETDGVKRIEDRLSVSGPLRGGV
ncbi:MAG: CBS domain-containing protein [Hyphomicrobiaceae bacterium]